METERERNEGASGAETTPTKQLLQGNVLIQPASIHHLSDPFFCSTEPAVSPPPPGTQSTSEAGLRGMDHSLRYRAPKVSLPLLIYYFSHLYISCIMTYWLWQVVSIFRCPGTSSLNEYHPPSLFAHLLYSTFTYCTMIYYPLQLHGPLVLLILCADWYSHIGYER